MRMCVYDIYFVFYRLLLIKSSFTSCIIHMMIYITLMAIRDNLFVICIVLDRFAVRQA